MFKKLIFLTSFLLVLGLVVPNVVFADVIEIPIAEENDDVEERADGSMYRDSSDLELIYDNDPTVPDDLQTVGLRFVDVQIPNGANIVSASVRFDADDVDDAEHVGDAYVIIEGELSPNAGAFEDITNNVTARARTTSQVAWGPVHWTEQHAKYNTPDISGIVQEIVNQADWASGNALVLIISQDPVTPSTGVVEPESFKDNATDNIDRRPTLLIEFAADGATVEPPVLEGPYLQDGGPDGIVSVQAENFHANTPQGVHTWEFLADQAGFTGTGYMQSLPNDGVNNNTVEDYTTLSPRLDYDVFFVTSGTHYLWRYGYRISGSDDSAHAAIDAMDIGGGDADRLQTGDTDGAWEWSLERRDGLGPAQIVVDEAGVHTISVWMREDGWIFDKLVLTTNPDYVPEGEGPADSGTGMPAGAYGADPANGAVDVKAAPTLTWMAPDDAFQHDLYLGTDADLVAAGDASVSMGSLSGASYDVDPNTPLSRGMTYYWKVDVTTGTARASETHPGNVWSFRVADDNTASWLATAEADAPAYLDTFVEDGLYDIGALSGDITYEFVVISNPDEQEASMALIGRRDFGDTQAGLKYEQWNNTGTYGATLFGVVDLDYGVPTSPGEYTVLTFVSSEASNTTALYVNGALAGSVDAAITLSGLVGIGYGAQGADMSDSFDNFDGTIFGVAIYDEALTDEQIAAHADAYFKPFEEMVPTNPGTEGLIAYYPLENDVLDASGNGNDGTIVGDPVFADGPTGYGMAMEFDGDGDYVDCGNAELFDITGEMTVACWIKVDLFDKNWQAIVTHGDSSWRIHRSSGSDNIAWGTSGADPADITGTTNVNDGAWHHIAGVFDGAQKFLYVDGAVDASADFTGNINSSAVHSVNIGENNQATGRFFAGRIDEVMIYNRGLSEPEVMYLAGKRATPVDPGTEDLLAYFPLENDVLDASGNGNDGTIVGDPIFVEGVVGMAMEFDGDDHVDTGNVEDLAEWTIGCWAMSPMAPSGDSPSGPVHREQNYQFNWNHSDENFRASVTVSAGGWHPASFGTLEADRWYYLAGSYDGETLKSYVDGDLITVNEDPSGPPAAESNSLKLARHAAADQFFTGTVDEAIVYRRVLSAGEIRYLAGFRAMDNPGTDNLIAAYAFENDVLDGTGNGNDATVNGDPVFVDGMVGMALEFDGDGDFLDCGADPILALEDAVSISAWIKVAVMGADHKVGGNQDGANGGYKMSVYNDKVEFEIRTAANSAVLNRSVAGGTIIEVDTWYHVVGVYSLEDGYIRTYVDGELDRELLTTEALGASPGSLVIGAEPFNTGSYNFNGIMDEVSVYNKALSAAEARYLANN